MAQVIVENVAKIAMTREGESVTKSMSSTFDVIIDCIPTLITMVRSIEPYIQDTLKTKKTFTRPSEFQDVVKNFTNDTYFLSNHYQEIQNIVVAYTNKLLVDKGNSTKQQEIKNALNTIIGSLAVEINTRMQNISLANKKNLEFANRYVAKRERENIEMYQKEDILTTLAQQTEEEITFRKISLPLFTQRLEEIATLYGFEGILI